MKRPQVRALTLGRLHESTSRSWVAGAGDLQRKRRDAVDGADGREAQTVESNRVTAACDRDHRDACPDRESHLGGAPGSACSSQPTLPARVAPGDGYYSTTFLAALLGVEVAEVCALVQEVASCGVIRPSEQVWLVPTESLHVLRAALTTEADPNLSP